MTKSPIGTRRSAKIFRIGVTPVALEELLFEAAGDSAGERADIFLSKCAEISRSAAQKLIADGNARLLKCGSAAESALDKKYRMTAGDAIAVEIPETEETECIPEEIPLDLRYEDGDVIVINKPRGTVVHPAPGHRTGTLVSALLYHCGDSLSAINGVHRPGIVHRIDMDTTGLILACKNDRAHLAIAKQLESHEMRRVYYAIVSGNFREDSGTVDAPIGRSLSDRKKMAVIRTPGVTARHAVTHWRVLERFGSFTLCEMRLETGRTHQIRVHMQHIGHRILGDHVYGTPTLFEKKNPGMFAGQMLHAGELTFTHPTDGVEVTVTAPPPDDFMAVVEYLRKNGERVQ